TRTDAEATRRRCAGLLRPPRHLQRTYRGDQWTTGTPARLGPRVPQPHQLHRTIAPRGRRIPTPPTPWIRMSRITRKRKLPRSVDRTPKATPTGAALQPTPRRPAIIAIYRRMGHGHRTTPPNPGRYSRKSHERPMAADPATRRPSPASTAPADSEVSYPAGQTL